MTATRPPAVAGSFYPADPAELVLTVDELLADVSNKPAAAAPKVLIVPHAGYVYSGPVAASAYAHLQQAVRAVHRVVLLGPVHRVPIRGLALPEAQALATPLGVIPVDADAVRAIAHLPQVGVSAAAHALEHSLEVQLPFLQRRLGDFSVVPLAVGSATPAEVAEVIDALWGGAETLIVISSDLSHYLPYAVARDVDGETAQQILALGPDTLTHEQACGATPVNGLLAVARRRRLRPALLDLRSSGDTAGPRDQVVGYSAFAFYEEGAHAH